MYVSGACERSGAVLLAPVSFGSNTASHGRSEPSGRLTGLAVGELHP